MGCCLAYRLTIFTLIINSGTILQQAAHLRATFFIGGYYVGRTFKCNQCTNSTCKDNNLVHCHHKCGSMYNNNGTNDKKQKITTRIQITSHTSTHVPRHTCINSLTAAIIYFTLDKQNNGIIILFVSVVCK